jgi:hypothetical protein
MTASFVFLGVVGLGSISLLCLQQYRLMRRIYSVQPWRSKMDDDVKLEVTRLQLITALKQWEVDAKANGWPERLDEKRHADSADYLIGLLKA